MSPSEPQARLDICERLECSSDRGLASTFPASHGASWPGDPDHELLLHVGSIAKMPIPRCLPAPTAIGPVRGLENRTRT